MVIKIKNNHSGEAIYSTEADFLKEAAEKAVKEKISLQFADLRFADLRDANLRDADLRDANLRSANLQGANLQGANLQGANLRFADLQGADLRCADLRDADLWCANLRFADLQGADLRDANLRFAVGNMREVKSAQFDLWPIVWTKDTLFIGWKKHAINEWLGFDDEKINNMSIDALSWWQKWKPTIKQIMGLSNV